MATNNVASLNNLASHQKIFIQSPRSFLIEIWLDQIENTKRKKVQIFCKRILGGTQQSLPCKLMLYTLTYYLAWCLCSLPFLERMHHAIISCQKILHKSFTVLCTTLRGRWLLALQRRKHKVRFTIDGTHWPNST
mgnify:CR=1 FL=1